MSLLGSIGRTIDRGTKAVTRTVKSVPVVGGVVRTGERALKGPIGRTLNSVMTNPIVSTAMGPVTIPANIAYGATTGGVKGATDAAKAELRNPVRRAAIKAVAVIFPPAAPGAVALEAANKLLDAAEKGDAVEAAKAAAQIAANVALADEGDEHAREVLGYLDKARDLRQKAAGVTVPMRKLTTLWQADGHARALMGDSVHKMVSPHRFQLALSGLRKAASGEVNPQAVKKHADLVAASLQAGMHHRTPFFSVMGLSAHRELDAIARLPQGARVLRLVEGKVMAKSLKRTKALNRKVLAYNSRDEGERRSARALVAQLKAGVQRGDTVAASRLDELRRRTAALKKAREFKVDSAGMVRHVGAR